MTAKANDLILVEPNDEQHSLLYSLMFVAPHNLYFETLPPNVIVLLPLESN